MQIHFSHKHINYSADLSKPLDLSIPLENNEGPNCFNAPAFAYEPVCGENWIGTVAEGCPVNFMNVKINPHGNGTHTECVGHIAEELYSVNKALTTYHFLAQLATFYPQKIENGDRIITKAMLEEVLVSQTVSAFIIRTMPNDNFKKTTNYSGANAPYLTTEAMQYIVDCNIEHLLLDLPSVDKEDDGGKVACHRIFWQYPENIRHHATITEMVYVKNSIKDGFYLLNLQIPPFSLDAAPSKPVLFELINQSI